IPQAELIGTKLLWRFDRLPAGTKKKILVKVIPVEEGQVGSIATVNFVAEVATRTAIVPTESVESPEPLTEEPTADSSVALQPVPPAADPVIDESSATEPQIALNVTGPESAKVGDTVVLKFNISNNGSTPAKDVALQDIIPVGFEHPAGNDLTYEVGAIEPGKSIDVELELKAAKPGTHVNQAVITAAGNFRTESKKKVEVSDSLGLMLEVRELPSKPIGEPITLAFRVTNQSSLPVDDAVLTAALPAKSQFISATASGEFNRADRSVTWTLGSLKAEAVTTFEAQFVPLDFGVQPVSGTLTQAGREPQTAKTNIDALGVAALKISVDNAPPTTSVGEEFTIDVKVTNRGNGADRGIQLSLLLPTELEFVNARGPVKQQAAQTEGEAKRVPFTTIPEIGEKASVDFQITLRARTAGRLKLRAEVDSDQLTAPLASDAAIVALDIAS
ncbi:MAG: CARDB domain-containing protein, partial [Planctomycetota bacterium]